jgi:hypothetical protein
MLAVTAKWLENLARELRCPAASPCYFKYIYIYTHIDIYIHTHSIRTASPSTTHGLLSAVTSKWLHKYTHENFFALARTKRQVHVNFHIYIYAYKHTYICIYIYIYTKKNRPAGPSTTHGPLSAVKAKWLQLPRKKLTLQLCAYRGKTMILFINIYIYTQTYI